MTRDLTTISSLLLSLSTLTSAASGSVPVTPHDSYSSSVGVLGCKINTNRVAYWPGSVDCTNICVSLSYSGRSVHLLRIDQSGGAHDVSYDAWNYLYTGKSATDAPTAGGAVQMDYEDVDAGKCRELIHTKGGKLPLSASNSMNFLASCLGEEGSWVGRNYVLYNIATPICTYGVDEVCTLDYPAENQASCPSGIGNTQKLTGDPVVDIRYPTGEKVVAGSGGSAPTGRAARREVGWGLLVVTVAAGWLMMVGEEVFM